MEYSAFTRVQVRWTHLRCEVKVKCGMSVCVCGCCGSVRSSTTEWLHEEEVVTEERVGEGRRSIAEVVLKCVATGDVHDA